MSSKNISNSNKADLEVSEESISDLTKHIICRLSALSTDYRDLDIDKSFERLRTKRQKLYARKRLERTLIGVSSVAALLVLCFVFFRQEPHPMIVQELLTTSEAKWIHEITDFSGVEDPYVLTLSFSSSKRFAVKGGDQDTIPLGEIINGLRKTLGIKGAAMFTVPITRKATTRLSDGSVVILDASSSMVVNDGFGEKNIREIDLRSGQAFFNVTHDKRHPFTVHTRNMDIQVLGTKFNVNAHPELTGITATLVSGCVRISGSRKRSFLLNKSGSQVITTQSGENIIQGNVSSSQLARITGWVNGVIEFKKTPLKDIMTTMGRQYDFTVDYESTDLSNFSLTGVLKRSFSAEYALKLLSRTSGYRFEYDKKKHHVHVRK